MLLGNLPDLEDTQAGKELIAIGIEKGIEKGIEEGELIGIIRTCQTVLGIESTSIVELRDQSIDKLRDLASELQQSLRNRLGTS